MDPQRLGRLTAHTKTAFLGSFGNAMLRGGQKALQYMPKSTLGKAGVGLAAGGAALYGGKKLLGGGGEEEPSPYPGLDKMYGQGFGNYVQQINQQPNPQQWAQPAQPAQNAAAASQPAALGQQTARTQTPRIASQQNPYSSSWQNAASGALQWGTIPFGGAGAIAGGVGGGMLQEGDAPEGTDAQYRQAYRLGSDQGIGGNLRNLGSAMSHPGDAMRAIWNDIKGGFGARYKTSSAEEGFGEQSDAFGIGGGTGGMSPFVTKSLTNSSSALHPGASNGGMPGMPGMGGFGGGGGMSPEQLGEQTAGEEEQPDPFANPISSIPGLGMWTSKGNPIASLGMGWGIGKGVQTIGGAIRGARGGHGAWAGARAAAGPGWRAAFGGRALAPGGWGAAGRATLAGRGALGGTLAFEGGVTALKGVGEAWDHLRGKGPSAHQYQDLADPRKHGYWGAVSNVYDRPWQGAYETFKATNPLMVGHKDNLLNVAGNLVADHARLARTTAMGNRRDAYTQEEITRMSNPAMDTNKQWMKTHDGRMVPTQAGLDETVRDAALGQPLAAEGTGDRMMQLSARKRLERMQASGFADAQGKSTYVAPTPPKPAPPPATAPAATTTPPAAPAPAAAPPVTAPVTPPPKVPQPVAGAVNPIK